MGRCDGLQRPVKQRQLALVLAMLTLQNIGVSLYYGEDSVSVRYLAIIALLVAADWPLARLQAPDRIQAMRPWSSSPRPSYSVRCP